MLRKIYRKESAQDTPQKANFKPAEGTPVRARRVPTSHSPSSPKIFDEERERAFKEAYARGYESGFQQGWQNAVQQQQEKWDSFRKDLQALIARIESAMALWYQKAEHGLTTLARDIAEKIIQEELQLNPQKIRSIVKDALRNVSSGFSARIRVNPFDLPALHAHREDLLASSAGIQQLEIVGDETLSRGSVLIECDHGIIDATVQAKLNNLCPPPDDPQAEVAA
jgi:flagellar biosynthesis/type III secretory pathway protein FliH